MCNIFRYLKPKNIIIKLKYNSKEPVNLSYIEHGNVIETIEGKLEEKQDSDRFQKFFIKHKNALISILIEDYVNKDQIITHSFHGSKLESVIIKVIDFAPYDTITLSNNNDNTALENWINYLSTLPNSIKTIDATNNGKKYKIRNKDIYSLIITDMLNYFLTKLLSYSTLLLILLFMYLFYYNYEIKQEIKQITHVYANE